MALLSQNKSYQTFLVDVKTKIQQAQVKASVAVNQQLLFLYWEMGKMILERQQDAQWGDKMLSQLSKDLQNAFPGVKGFSVRNLKYMRRFARENPDIEFGQAPLAQISWYHNITLLTKCKDTEERLWYAQQAIEHGWSRNVMVHQIELNLFKRKGKALNNFDRTLPDPQSDMAQQALKDPYIFDFLAIEGKFREKELEDNLIEHITSFLLELGVGFAFIGKQYHLPIGGEDFYIDLLFYHTKLHCYVAVELKTTKFKAEYAGKMNLYLAGLDTEVKSAVDQTSIGLIICKDKNQVVAEYALKNISTPIGISAYELRDSLPEEFESILPSIEEIERELGDG